MVNPMEFKCRRHLFIFKEIIKNNVRHIWKNCNSTKRYQVLDILYYSHVIPKCLRKQIERC